MQREQFCTVIVQSLGLLSVCDCATNAIKKNCVVPEWTSEWRLAAEMNIKIQELISVFDSRTSHRVRQQKIYL